MERRDFFRLIFRNGLLFSLLGGSAYLVTRKKKEGEDCNFDFVCRSCRKNTYCKLNEASIFRMNKRKALKDEKVG